MLLQRARVATYSRKAVMCRPMSANPTLHSAVAIIMTIAIGALWLWTPSKVRALRKAVSPYTMCMCSHFDSFVWDLKMVAVLLPL